MPRSQETDVLVVGAGPVGLFTAVSLVDQGVRVTVIDKHWRTHSYSYALALHAETLRLLDELSLAEELIDSGHVVDRLAFYEGSDRRAEVDLSTLGGKFPYVGVVPQSSLEWALESWLRERGVPVLWNHELTSFAVRDGRVTGQVTRYDKQSLGYPIARTDWVAAEELSIVASQIVGADGYHSRVRQQLDIQNTIRGGSQLYSVIEFSASLDLSREARVVLDQSSTNVLWPMGVDRYRWTFSISDTSEHLPSVEGLKKLARERAPWFEAEAPIILWSAPVRFERRVANHFAVPHVWLAGDAAHLTGPIGAQSMNVGIREGRDVAGHITDVLGGADLESRIEKYDSDRRSEWELLLGGGQDPISSESWSRRQEMLSSLPGSGRDLDQMLAQVGLRS